MFHFDHGLKITALDLGIDMRRRQARAFVSHAHGDHLASHEVTYCTPATGVFYQRRLGSLRAVRDLPYDQPLVWGDYRLRTLPAGHILGSSMLWVEGPEQSLLYTGDFRLGPSLTAEPARLVRADKLVMECTFGDPRYRLPSRDAVTNQLLEIVRKTIAAGMTPVIHAYVLGKAQEITRILTDHGHRVLQHPDMHDFSRLYESLGCRLGDFDLYRGKAVAGEVVIVPPRGQRQTRARIAPPLVRIAVTGWARDERARFTLGVDYAIPFSDHADFDELLACVEQVQPRQVYCCHGPRSFVDELRCRGIDARWLDAGCNG